MGAASSAPTASAPRPYGIGTVGALLAAPARLPLRAGRGARLAPDGELQPWVDRLALQRQHAGHALVDPAQRLAASEPLQPLDPQRKLTQGQPALPPDAAYPQPLQVRRLQVLRSVDDPQILRAPNLECRLRQAAPAPDDRLERLHDHPLAAR